ncbi:DUF2125 domain-containing protein [Oryzifoliimicrobium ureilyticus]|uniref:DUF2125 domain-containing protein n=1 Tax=Oryzifoliimicrobium ureilyticus TaxID=3113724 RepID=UPI0030760FC4
MAASSRSASGKKFWLLGGIILLAIALYTAGWFYAAHQLEKTVLKAITPKDKETAAVTGQCQDIDFRGYPFRIGLFCSKVTVDDRSHGISASFGELRSAAQVYQPQHIVWELDSPAEIRDAEGMAVNAEWKNMQSSLVTKSGGIERSSTVVDGLQANATFSRTDQAMSLTADHTEAHLRQNGPDLDGAFSFSGAVITIKDWPNVLPKFSGTGDVTLAGKAGLIDGSDGKGLRGSSGELRNLAADLGDGRIMTLTGPFSFNDQGYLSGKFKLKISELDQWRKSAKAAFPDLGKSIDSVSKLLKAMAIGSNSVSVDLVVDQGQATVSGFIPLGSIPPI